MDTRRRLSDAWRRLALAAVVAAGIWTVIASGGGLPGDCPPGMDCVAPLPLLSVDVQPAYATVLVGNPVTYTATASSAAGNVAYQWGRSSDGGITFVDIPGATGRAYRLPAASLADDATVFRVTVRDSSPVTARASGRLAVSATPGLVFRDTEFKPEDWLVTPFGNAAGPAPAHAEETLPDGGNPGAFRRMVIQIPPQAGAGRVFYTSLVSTYAPGTQGAIRLIDYAEDGISLQPNELTYTQSALLLEQAGRRYVANLRNDATAILSTSWTANQSRASLRAEDFNLMDGPPCGPAEACPDFTAAGGLLRFGYWRISFGSQGSDVAHGIDNWQVTVWRR